MSAMIEALELAHRIVEDEAIWRAYEHKRELRRLLGSRTPLPEDFCFRLSLTEAEEVQRSRSQIVTLKRGQNIKYLPHAFTEHGAIMAAMVLNSPEAVAMSVFVVRAFMQMREQLAANTAILKRLAEIDQTLLEHNSALRTLWTKLQPLLAPPPAPPKRRIGFNADRP
jgi:hypothetical protein